MGRSKRAVVASTDVKVRSSAWDQVMSEELAFDFSPRAAVPAPALRKWGLQEKGSVKEAIIRWLDEQL
jgi:hypothetical protein